MVVGGEFHCFNLISIPPTSARWQFGDVAIYSLSRICSAQNKEALQMNNEQEIGSDALYSWKMSPADEM